MKILLVIDMQNDFIDGALGTKEAVSIVPNVQRKIQHAKESGVKIIFTRDTHFENYMDTQEGHKLPVRHCIKGTKGWEISSLLDTEEADIIDKISFGSIELAEYVEAFEPEEITMVGLCTDICVISNAMILKARMPEVPITVDAVCCAGVTPDSHENALAAMQMCQIGILNA